MIDRKAGVAQIEGFVESLRRLIEVEQYSITDISYMFGVSRGRMAQLAARYGFTTNGVYPRGVQAYRLWNEEEGRFRPVRRSALRRTKAGRARFPCAQRGLMGKHIFWLTVEEQEIRAAWADLTNFTVKPDGN